VSYNRYSGTQNKRCDSLLAPSYVSAIAFDINFVPSSVRTLLIPSNTSDLPQDLRHVSLVEFPVHLLMLLAAIGSERVRPELSLPLS
jgi:hypothetical protein